MLVAANFGDGDLEWYFFVWAIVESMVDSLSSASHRIFGDRRQEGDSNATTNSYSKLYEITGCVFLKVFTIFGFMKKGSLNPSFASQTYRVEVVLVVEATAFTLVRRQYEQLMIG
jgi:hypothetical protein